MNDGIDLRAEIHALCDALGVPYNHTARITLTAPYSAEAVVYLLNEDGEHYVDETGEPAVETLTFEVST